MARIRTIKPELPSDQRLARCSIAARYTFVALITQADDYGLVPALPRQLLGMLFPADEALTVEEVGGWLAELAAAGLIAWRWRQDGGPVIQLVGWEKHQRIDNRRKAVLLHDLDAERRDPPTFAEIRREPPRASDTIAATRRESPLEPPTSDLRPPTVDLRPPTSGAARKKRDAAPEVVRWPHFPDEARAAVLASFRKLAELPPGRVLNAVGPYFRAPDDPDFVAHEHVLLAIADYCGLAPKGRSAPFASPEDCAKRLGTLIRNVQQQNRHDPLARVDAQLVAIHGQLPRVA